MITNAGDVVQLVRTLPCHGRGRGFESRRPRHESRGMSPQLSIDSGVHSLRIRLKGRIPKALRHWSVKILAFYIGHGDELRAADLAHVVDAKDVLV